MSIAGKQRVAQAAYIAGFALTVFCLLQMGTKGRSSPGAAKLWFALMVLSVVITIPFALAFYYYRARSKNLENIRIEANILSATGKNLKQKPPQK